MKNSQRNLFATHLALAVILITALIVIPKIVEVKERNRVMTSLRRLSSLAAALDYFAEHEGHYPISRLTNISTRLSEIVAVSGINSLVARDAWENEFRYISSGRNYFLFSLGSNNQQDLHPGGGAMADSRWDIAYFSGKLWQGPEGL